MPQNAGPSASLADGANAAPRGLHRGRTGGCLRFAQRDGFGALAADAAMRVFDQREGGTQSVLPRRGTALEEHSQMRRGEIRRCRRPAIVQFFSPNMSIVSDV